MNAIIIVILLLLPLIIPAYASYDEWDYSCYKSGFNAGQNGPFSQATYDHCGDEEGGDDAYYNGFINGCMKADNSEEVCEQATDAE